MYMFLICHHGAYGRCTISKLFCLQLKLLQVSFIFLLFLSLLSGIVFFRVFECSCISTNPPPSHTPQRQCLLLAYTARVSLGKLVVMYLVILRHGRTRLFPPRRGSSIRFWFSLFPSLNTHLLDFVSDPRMTVTPRASPSLYLYCT